MRSYFFGYLFVRLAKIIAVLILVCGVGGAAMRYFQGSLEAASVRYEAGRLLGSKLFALSQEWDHTNKLVAEFMGRAPLKTTPLWISKVPDTVTEFETLARQLAVIQGERAAVKSALVLQFENLVIEIEKKLRAHASSLVEQQPPKPSQAAAEKPDAANSDEPTTPKTLFAPLDRSELALRRDVFKESTDFLSVLRSSSENPDNEKILARAVNELENLERLLPATFEITPPRKTPKQENDSTPPPAPKVNAERVADKLQQARSLVRAALLTEWAVDHALDEATTEADREQRRCLEADRALKRLWLSVGYSIVLVLLASIVTAFFILVLADLTQALLDAATNSAAVASAYQNTGTVEEEAG